MFQNKKQNVSKSMKLNVSTSLRQNVSKQETNCFKPRTYCFKQYET